MKFSNSFLYQLSDLSELGKKDMPFKEARKFIRFIDNVQKEIAIVEPFRKSIMDKYSKGIKDGNYITPKEGENDYEAFMSEWQECFGAITEIPYEPFDIDAMGSKNADIKPDALRLIEQMNEAFKLESQEKKEA